MPQRNVTRLRAVVAAPGAARRHASSLLLQSPPQLPCLRAAGLLKPIDTTCARVRDGGVNFLIATAHAAAAADDGKAADSASDAAAAAAGAGGGGGAKPDPFARDVRDERMVVKHVPPLHVLMLNRFATLAGHSLLVTDDFQVSCSLCCVPKHVHVDVVGCSIAAIAGAQARTRVHLMAAGRCSHGGRACRRLDVCVAQCSVARSDCTCV
jgi:Ap4A phosphorylase N-terminal domain